MIGTPSADVSFGAETLSSVIAIPWAPMARSVPTMPGHVTETNGEPVGGSTTSEIVRGLRRSIIPQSSVETSMGCPRVVASPNAATFVQWGTSFSSASGEACSASVRNVFSSRIES